MKRRAFLALSTGIVTGLAGCATDAGSGAGDGTASTAPTATATRTADSDEAQEIGGDDDTATTGTDRPSPREVTSNPNDPKPADGYPPEPDSVPAERDIDTGAYETIEVDGEQVRLAPVEDVHYWWSRREARFADARGMAQYRNEHVYGAVSSPAGSPVDISPVADWSQSDRIICYCGCPHHLSSVRAAELQQAGYSNVFVIDEGYYEWKGLDYPVVGENVSERRTYRIRGRVRPEHQGEMVWVREVGSDRMEAAPIQADGSFSVHVKFADVTGQTRVTVELPTGDITGTLASLSTRVVSG
ncbi:rhodanese-like domain-containing protein [Haloarchaeobius sp. TZWSO28]|uniref:rhodanese-like domain-containing protein n=1 Tax=Haloarchaeobius sp. TZWSO28 TaxID=3446119 RepID=UPI003EB743AA